jgi:hypothetical protein
MSDIDITITNDGQVTVTASINSSNRDETLKFIETISPQLDKIQAAAQERTK